VNPSGSIVAGCREVINVSSIAACRSAPNGMIVFVFSSPRGAPASGSSSESAAEHAGAPQRAGAKRRSPRGLPVVKAQEIAVAREGAAKQRSPGEAWKRSGSEEEPRAWQPRGARDEYGPRDRAVLTCQAPPGEVSRARSPGEAWKRSGSEEEPRAWQPRGARDEHGPRDSTVAAKAQLVVRRGGGGDGLGDGGLRGGGDGA